MDVLDPVTHYLRGIDWDGDRNHLQDLIEPGKGKPWMDQMIIDSRAEMLSLGVTALEARDAYWAGNGAYWSGPDGIDSPLPFGPDLHGAYDAGFPTYPWYDAWACGAYTNTACPTVGIPAPTIGDYWSLHMWRYMNWEDNARDPQFYMTRYTELNDPSVNPMSRTRSRASVSSLGQYLSAATDTHQ